MARGMSERIWLKMLHTRFKAVLLRVVWISWQNSVQPIEGAACLTHPGCGAPLPPIHPDERIRVADLAIEVASFRLGLQQLIVNGWRNFKVLVDGA